MAEIARKKRPKIGMSYGEDGAKAVLKPAEQHVDTRAEVLVKAEEQLTTKVEFVNKIQVLWQEAQHQFVRIGRYLNQAKARLAHGEFEPMIRRELPFSHQVANKLMAVAAAIDTQLIGPEELPTSWTTAYELVSLNDAERVDARKRGLVRPDVTREEVMAYKAQMRAGDPVEAKRRLLQRLIRQRERLEQKIAVLEQELKLNEC
jgi:hypothetical protein